MKKSRYRKGIAMLFEQKNLNLSQLKLGQEGVITKINIKDKAIKRHLLDMGLTCGTNVKIKKMAPTGDPIDIELRGYELCIAKHELEQIEVEVI